MAEPDVATDPMQTAWYVHPRSPRAVYAQMTDETGVLGDPLVVLVPHMFAERVGHARAEQLAALIVAWWNETHASPDAPTTDNPVEGIEGG